MEWTGVDVMAVLLGVDEEDLAEYVQTWAREDVFMLPYRWLAQGRARTQTVRELLGREVSVDEAVEVLRGLDEQA
ncbi:MAG: hypothetical protein E6640_01830 [Actinomyces urogenitalis]|uniref:hypothetical protein n=1 Tax=Actinomyces urogenitalis TaxID=103621 RepID=UPI00290C1F35|nr:hypothetical protein [Actinomyces urogenitalis]MDU6150951.1 hypothetical protein [Actinomyces urogenitalis]